MIPIDFVERLPEVEVEDKLGFRYTKAMSEAFFAWEGKLVGGIARETLIDPPEVWVAVQPAFRPRDIFRLREVRARLATRYPYLRARVQVGDKVGTRFAFAFGFMYEETVGLFHFFSVRA